MPVRPGASAQAGAQQAEQCGQGKEDTHPIGLGQGNREGPEGRPEETDQQHGGWPVGTEGVDLQQDCRHVIHHDLDWNPSTLEQRTGRIDRIGSKAEAVSQPVVIYEPFLSGTHDEKMYRVVKDRERWFGVVMGQTVATSERATEQQAARAPLPSALADSLTMHLSLDPCP